jgi:hypothetical protein
MAASLPPTVGSTSYLSSANATGIGRVAPLSDDLAQIDTPELADPPLLLDQLPGLLNFLSFLLGHIHHLRR